MTIPNAVGSFFANQGPRLTQMALNSGKDVAEKAITGKLSGGGSPPNPASVILALIGIALGTLSNLQHNDGFKSKLSGMFSFFSKPKDAVDKGEYNKFIDGLKSKLSSIGATTKLAVVFGGIAAIANALFTKFSVSQVQVADAGVIEKARTDAAQSAKEAKSSAEKVERLKTDTYDKFVPGGSINKQLVEYSDAAKKSAAEAKTTSAAVDLKLENAKSYAASANAAKDTAVKFADGIEVLSAKAFNVHLSAIDPKQKQKFITDTLAKFKGTTLRHDPTKGGFYIYIVSTNVVTGPSAGFIEGYDSKDGFEVSSLPDYLDDEKLPGDSVQACDDHMPQ